MTRTRFPILKNTPDLIKHVFSLAVSLAVHGILIFLLAVHFASVKIIDFGSRVTEVVIAPPPTGQLRLPGGSRLPAGLPAIEPDFPDFLPLRTRLLRPPEPSAEETAGPAGPSLPADSRLTGGFTLENPPPQKPSLPSGASLRLPIAERSGEPTAGVKGYASSPRAGDLRRYLYGGMIGTGGASGGFFPGEESGKTRARGRASVPSSIRRYDLTPWARSVV